MSLKTVYTLERATNDFDRQCYDVSPVAAQGWPRGTATLSDKHSLSLSVQKLEGGVDGQTYNLCLGYSCGARRRQVNGNIIKWFQL